MEQKNKNKPLRKLIVGIHGLVCGDSLILEDQVIKLKGVAMVYVNLATSEAYIDVSDDFKVDEMLRLIEKNGFEYEEPQWN